MYLSFPQRIVNETSEFEFYEKIKNKGSINMICKLKRLQKNSAFKRNTERKIERKRVFQATKITSEKFSIKKSYH